ncbi:MAG: DUF1735 and LamG domain-containing protein [Breznakibacter sp.]
MKYNKLGSMFLLMAAFISGCKNDDIYDSNFDSQLYIDQPQKVSTILVKGGIGDFTKTLHVSSAKKVDQRVDITFKVNPEMVETYNNFYYDKALMLPAENYETGIMEAYIPANGVKSTDVEISFMDLKNLDREQVYVLPVTMDKAEGAEVLASGRNHFFVFKGAALINVVGDIEANFLSVQWAKPDALKGLKNFTVECLVRVRNFDKLISTVIGIEGQLLLRLGDAGFPSNQLQIASSSGNWPASESSKGLPANEWVHIALTCSETEGGKIFQDGKLQSESSSKKWTLNWGGNSNFFIGKSYDNNRDLRGEMSELRIWNYARSKDEIAANPYYVDALAQGLVAYWKFDEGSGALVKDHSVNGNHAVANGILKWTQVSLPAKSN